MSCQQASRFITAAATTTVVTTKSTPTTKRIATATPTTITAATAKTAAAKTTPLAVVVENNIGVAAAKTNTPEDPYVFTETIASTPPILFNAQKSRARLSVAQHSRNCSNNSKQRVANKKASIVAATTAPIAQFNGTATAAAATVVTVATARAVAAAATATTKAQASLGAAAANTATNFNNVTQSQRQPTSQSQLQLQSPLQLQSQASPKRATNVCVVRPQQQLQQQQQQQQQLQQLKQQQSKLTIKQPAPHLPPPPLYTHTPSLWQTPLILDSTQKQQQQQQSSIVVATALVSPPTSPASLPSPTANSPPTAAVTAMVSPIVVPLSPASAAMSPPKGGSLPPSKFHHTTLAQHLQKVECLKKKKSLPLACQNSNNHNNNILESLPKSTTPFAAYNLTHPPPLTVFNTSAAAVTPAAVGATTKKHSADATDDNNDLNEIPVNVIFRKPPELLAGVAAQTPPRPAVAIEQQAAITKLGAVAPLTPPTPPTLSSPSKPLLANVCTQSPVTAAVVTAPALLTTSATAGVATAATAAAASIASIQYEQMSSKVANSVVSNAAALKRKAPVASTGCRKGNKTNKNAAQETPPSATAQPVQDAAPTLEAASVGSVARRRKVAPAAKSTTVLLSENEPLELDVPYCLQTRWLHAGKHLGQEPQSALSNREERIALRKGVLRRQALQLLSTRTLQQLPMREARQRLQSVQSLLLKYGDHASQQQGIGVGNRCLVAACKQPTLSMAAHCERHIINNTTQQLFQPCVAWRVDGVACQAPVFDVLHTLALCPVHSHLRHAVGVQSKQQQPQQRAKVLQQGPKLAPTPAVPGPVPATVVAANAPVAIKRKRKTNPNANPVGRPQKRAKKLDASTNSTLPVMPPVSAVLQRKSSTTSLESIASNSQSSAKSHSALQPYTPTAPVLTMPQQSIPPALAPLSDYQLQQQQLLPKIESEQPTQQVDANLLANANFKADEISQIVAQLAAASSELHHNNNDLHFNNNNNSNMNYYSNNNSNSGSSSISCGFPSFNAAFGNAMSGQGQQVASHHANTSLASTESMLGQHMFGICENSSAYASSEDTGLGGLSESELIGANDADDIALNGAHLLEEHDLVNVFDTLPDDAFNELFQSVQQAECEAMDRALEIADKNLKCLQQTIGNTAHDSAFLNDFLDVGDDLLVNAVSSVMNSPNTSGIDASTLFVDSSGGGNSSSNGAAGSSSNSCTSAASVADIRGLVQT
ncbi:mucin-2 [Drosophila montana]|uniref:mucin-2 n=1 Tax=Drosophila montana TaxID=40370 RepID=UPI00313CCB68